MKRLIGKLLIDDETKLTSVHFKFPKGVRVPGEACIHWCLSIISLYVSTLPEHLQNEAEDAVFQAIMEQKDTYYAEGNQKLVKRKKKDE